MLVTYDLWVVGEWLGFTCFVVGLPLQLNKYRGWLLKVQVSVLWGLEDDSKLRKGSVQQNNIFQLDLLNVHVLNAKGLIS